MKNYNLLVKRIKDQEYIITDFIATKLNEKEFLKIKELNPALLENYCFIAYKETDFSWWDKVSKKLTKTKIQKAYFNIDFYGNVKEY